MHPCSAVDAVNKMGKPPAVVIIVRHGARIDVVDKRWHLTSPTPYDPPLTYGGWTQSRALGARIASLLHAREEAVYDTIQVASSSKGADGSSTEASSSGQDSDSQHSYPKRVRKHKVIIHSSPYIRCVQTSIAISAGMSQFHGTFRSSGDASPILRPVSADFSPASTSVMRPKDHAVGEQKQGHHSIAHRPVPKTRLRIDAFLGEWLSPDYFEQITPPPSSVMMVVGAKGELLKRGEGIPRAHDAGSKSFSGHFPGGWRSNLYNAAPADDDEGKFNNMSAMANALVQPGRSGGHNGVESAVKPITIRDVIPRNSSHTNDDMSEGYIPPVPSYAISLSDPIPLGYVAHARDACVDVDYQWDSMREPQNWGNGGEYGEEWSAMHLRFRNGLQSMIDWYRKHDHPHRHHHHHHHHHHEDDSDDEFTDVVLVLVTHGAGCNALIGALTNQPVLLDVAMASLTMAVRKDIIEGKDAVQTIEERAQQQGKEQCRPSFIDISPSQEYDTSLIASMEHLQTGSNPLSIPQLPTPTIQRSASISAYRHRPDYHSLHHEFEHKSSAPHQGSGLQRAATTSHHFPRSAAAGLWGTSFSKAEGAVTEPAEDDRDNVVPNFGEPASASSSKQENGAKTLKSQITTIEEPPEQFKSQHGLWSSAAIAQEREPVQKRRWTVTGRR